MRHAAPLRTQKAGERGDWWLNPRSPVPGLRWAGGYSTQTGEAVGAGVTEGAGVLEGAGDLSW